MLARVQNDGEFSDPFPVTNGVKQGFALASTLFSRIFSAMLTDAFQDSDNGLPIRYHFDGKLFNLTRLRAKSEVLRVRHYQQSFLPQTSRVLSATGNLELRMASSAIFEHTNSNTSRILLGLVIVSN